MNRDYAETLGETRVKAALVLQGLKAQLENRTAVTKAPITHDSTTGFSLSNDLSSFYELRFRRNHTGLGQSSRNTNSYPNRCSCLRRNSAITALLSSLVFKQVTLFFNFLCTCKETERKITL